MICKKCNHEYSDDLAACPVCGEPKPSETITESVKDTVSAGYGSGNRQGYDVPLGERYGKRYDEVPRSVMMTEGQRKGGTTPLVLGILSLFVPYVGIVLGILAIVFGNSAKKTNPQGSTDYALGHAGWVLGIVGLAFQTFLVIYVAVVFNMVFNIIGDISRYAPYTFSDGGFGMWS